MPEIQPPISVNGCLLLGQAAPPPAGPPWWLFALFAAIGLVMIGLGGYAIRTRRAIVGRRQMAFLRMFGIQEVTPKWAVIIGVGQCGAGGMMLLLALVGPFIAGTLADKAPANAGQQAQPSAGGDGLVAGLAQGTAYTDAAPAGGLLVGLRCARGINYGGALRAVQPIYQVDAGYVMGQRHGQQGGEEFQLQARPGYAVGAIRARAGFVVNALQLVFYRIDGRRLDPDDRYESPWVGSENGPAVELDGQGDPITGLHGTWGDAVASIGVTPADDLTGAIRPATEPPPDLLAEPHEGGLVGYPLGTVEKDVAPVSGFLAGVRAFCDETSPRIIRSLQAIYVTPQGYTEGRRLGEGGSVEVLAVARPGYVVSGFGFTGSGDVCGLRVRYKKLVPGGADGEASYESDWLGHGFDRIDQESTADERVVIGLASYHEGSLRGLGMMLIGSDYVHLDAAPELPSQYRRDAWSRPALRAGSDQGNLYLDHAPDGGLLVGLRLAKGTSWGGAVQAVQPIYQVGTGYVLGQRHGKQGGREYQLLARPGYAVGAIQARAGIALNAVKVVFYRVDGRRLNPGDGYETDWVGASGGSPSALDARGDPINGIFGTSADELISLGLSPTIEPREPIPLAEGPPPTSD